MKYQVLGIAIYTRVSSAENKSNLDSQGERLKAYCIAKGYQRVGFNYLKVLLNKQGKDIEVVNLAEERKDDLMPDFVAIITSFCARLYSIRRRTRKTECLIKCLQENQDEISRKTSN